MSDTSPQERRRITFFGRVQGVGFRYTTRDLARRFEVAGYVLNMPDGSVQLVAEGESQELDRFEQAITRAMADNIKRKDVVTSPASGEFETFEIRHY